MTSRTRDSTGFGDSKPKSIVGEMFRGFLAQNAVSWATRALSGVAGRKVAVLFPHPPRPRAPCAEPGEPFPRPDSAPKCAREAGGIGAILGGFCAEKVPKGTCSEHISPETFDSLPVSDAPKREEFRKTHSLAKAVASGRNGSQWRRG